MTEAYRCGECRDYLTGPPAVSVSVREALLISPDSGERMGTPPELEGLDGYYCYDCAIDTIGHGGDGE